MKRSPLIGKTYGELEEATLELGGSSVHARKLATWLYRRGAGPLMMLETLPLSVRLALANKFQVGIHPPLSFSQSRDGTKKYLFESSNKLRYESVYMPGQKRNTLCISTQAGCRVGCAFCLTGSMGLYGNLDPGEIINQLLAIGERRFVNRLVLMGMGEPFDNYGAVEKSVGILTAEWGAAFGASNITLSTVGILEPLQHFLHKPFCNLAVSLHSPFPEERRELMPIEASNPIRRVIELLRAKPIQKPLRLSFEYLGLGGVNLTRRHAEAIAKLCVGLKYHVNIIPWNHFASDMFMVPRESDLTNFAHHLNRVGVLCTIRESKGGDIRAACGQMVGARHDKANDDTGP